MNNYGMFSDFSLSAPPPAKASVCSLPRSPVKSSYSYQLHREQRGTHSAGMCRKNVLSRNHFSLFSNWLVPLQTMSLKICQWANRWHCITINCAECLWLYGIKPKDGWLYFLCKIENFQNKPKMFWDWKTQENNIFSAVLNESEVFSS